jgi:peptidoglycan/LPS O-acetylase OafA/YrhL
MKKKHIDKMDFARGIAVLMVVLFHTLIVVFPNFPGERYSGDGLLKIKSLKEFLLKFNPAGQGWMGVELFLVISGFLIHLIYIQNRDTFKWKYFFSKRFWRIYPPYLLALLIFFLALGGSSTFTNLSLLMHVLMVHNLDSSEIFKINGSFWSLALEVQLYLLYPMYLSMESRLKPHGMLLILLALNFAFSLSAYVYGIRSFAFNNFVLKYWFIWGLGAFLADKYVNQERVFEKPLRWFALIYLMTFSFKLNYLTKHFITIPAGFACLALLEALLYSKTLERNRNSLAFKSICFIGIMSYSIYLIHLPLLARLYKFLSKQFFRSESVNLNTLLTLAVSFVIIFSISYLYYRTIEVTSIRYGEQLRKKNEGI